MTCGLLLTVAIASRASGVVNCGVVTCPQQSIFVVERLGRFHRMLNPGLHWTMPWPLESIYALELRERP